MHTPRRRAAIATLAATLLTAALLLVGGIAPTGVAGAQPGATTTTLPTDNRELGNIIPKPNAGMEPQTAGDPGGWLQVSLFFLICAAILGMVAIVWWQARRARARRDAAGYDPVELARERGEGLRPVSSGSGSADAS